MANIIHRMTVIKRESQIDEFVMDIAKYLYGRGYGNISISDSYPVVIKGVLKCMVTITATSKEEV